MLATGHALALIRSPHALRPSSCIWPAPHLVRRVHSGFDIFDRFRIVLEESLDGGVLRQVRSLRPGQQQVGRSRRLKRKAGKRDCRTVHLPSSTTFLSAPQATRYMTASRQFAFAAKWIGPLRRVKFDGIRWSTVAPSRRPEGAVVSTGKRAVCQRRQSGTHHCCGRMTFGFAPCARSVFTAPPWPLSQAMMSGVLRHQTDVLGMITTRLFETHTLKHVSSWTRFKRTPAACSARTRACGLWRRRQRHRL